MDKKTIERMPDLLRRLVDDYLETTKKLETVRVGGWLDARDTKPKRDPNERPFWATVKVGQLSRVVLVAWFDGIGFAETSDIYAESYGDQILAENILYWMPTNQPLYPASI